MHIMSIRYIIAACVALTTIAPVAHAAERSELAVCAAEKNSVKRLACFDALADKHGAAPATQPTTAAGAGKWKTSTTTDPMTDKSVYVAKLSADSGRSQFGGAIGLTVRCRNNKTELYIDWQDFLGLDRTPVTYRVGKQAARTSDWPLSTDNKATFFPGSPVAVLKEIMQVDSLVANTTPYSESPVTAVFNTTGAASALADIRKGCNW